MAVVKRGSQAAPIADDIFASRPRVVDLLLQLLTPEQLQVALSCVELADSSRDGVTVRFADVSARKQLGPLRDRALRIASHCAEKGGFVVQQDDRSAHDLVLTKDANQQTELLTVVPFSQSLSSGPLRAFRLVDLQPEHITRAWEASRGTGPPYSVEIIANLEGSGRPERLWLGADDIVSSFVLCDPTYTVPLFRHAGKIEFVDDFASSRRHDTHPPISLASKVVMAARIVLGCSVLVAAGALRIWWPSLEEALSTALFLCGFVVLAHVGISHFLTLSTSSQATPDERNEVVRHLVEIIIAAAGTVLGLMTVFGEAPIGLTLKVAVAALSSALFTGVVVFGLHGPHMTTTSTRADVARSVLVNIVFFSLILGVSCMLMALIFDETVKPVK